ncbi:uncharacterized protein LOC136073070 [Hydra vulgaris]|uniref:uncharacterized protein LOC136073070 n=1 Tax=Hydra vulgaris TaxID=6087 RepID=UPI0032EA1CD9
MDPDRDLKWTDELANELHKPVIKHFRKRKVISNGIDEIWAADLVDMQAFSKLNDGVKYLLMVIDHVKALGVQLYSTENEEKSCLVERWNRTMKEKMFKYFSANSTRKYIDVLDEMVNQYNNTKHSSINMNPVEESNKKNENIVFLNLNGKVRSNPINEVAESPKSKFSVGDKVRITKKDCLKKDTQQDGLKRTTKNDSRDIRIDKVIRNQGNKSLVKWYGYSDTFNSWENFNVNVNICVSATSGNANTNTTITTTTSSCSM